MSIYHNRSFSNLKKWPVKPYCRCICTGLTLIVGKTFINDNKKVSCQTWTMQTTLNSHKLLQLHAIEANPVEMHLLRMAAVICCEFETGVLPGKILA